jgi:hypothetical protein
MSDWKHWTEHRAFTRLVLAKTSSAIYVREALAVLRREFPRSEIVLWTEERESDEFYRHPSVARVVLYRNLRAIPAMLDELRTLSPYLLVTERTYEPTYDKMRIFSCLLLRDPGIVLDDSMRIVAFGVWPHRLLLTTGEVLATTFRHRMKVRSIASSVACFLVFLGSLLAAPFVFLALLAGAARIEMRRSIRKRARGLAGGEKDCKSPPNSREPSGPDLR